MLQLVHFTSFLSTPRLHQSLLGGRCKSGPSTFLLPKRRLCPSKLTSGDPSSLILNGFSSGTFTTSIFWVVIFDISPPSERGGYSSHVGPSAASLVLRKRTSISPHSRF